MDLTYSDEYDSYAATLRGFLAENWDRSRARDKEFVKSFRVKATSKGYLYRGIPEKYGGSEQPADVIKAQIISDEFSEARAPREVPDIGMMMVVPTLLELGEDWQKDFFIERLCSVSTSGRKGIQSQAQGQTWLHSRPRPS